jgi:predicted RNA binding protein YcfA (HicA-like mRNA interferase family)
MRLPRDLSADHLIRALKLLGYQVTRQTGGHARLTTHENGEHHVTIPKHAALRVGTVSAILAEVANHFRVSKEELKTRIFKH